MPTAKKTTTAKNFLILTSSCGKPEQMAFDDLSTEHSTLEAAEKRLMTLGDDLRDFDVKAAYIVKIIGVARPSGIKYEKV